MLKILKKIKYPKFMFLFLTFIAAYAVLYGESYSPLRNYIVSLGYIGAFFAGILYSYGFTAAFATSIFLILAKHHTNIYVMGLVGGFGSLFADLILFEFIRHSFKDEIDKLAKEKIIIYFYKGLPAIIKKSLLPILAGIVIASPLPDEVGVPLLASIKTFSVRAFSLISYTLNTAGIIFILYIGKNFI